MFYSTLVIIDQISFHNFVTSGQKHAEKLEAKVTRSIIFTFLPL